MKKLGLLIVVLGMGFLSGCSGSAEAGLDQLAKLGATSGQVSPPSPPVVTEADADLVGVQARVDLTDSDCSDGLCEVTVHFKNQGGKQARGVESYFEFSSEAIVASASSDDQDTVDPEGDLSIDLEMNYDVDSVPSGKLGTLKLNYIKNENGDQGTIAVEIYKQ